MILIRGAIKRSKGFIYYVDGKGNICVAGMDRDYRGNGRPKRIKRSDHLNPRMTFITLK